MKVLLTTIPSDSHTWNLVFMQLFLEEQGCEVINLGACTPIDLIVKNTYSIKPDMIVVSSINGHANIEGVRLAKEIRKNDLLRKVKLVVGGKLGTKGTENDIYKEKLSNAGFCGVFGGNSSIDDFNEFLYGMHKTVNSTNRIA